MEAEGLSAIPLLRSSAIACLSTEQLRKENRLLAPMLSSRWRASRSRGPGLGSKRRQLRLRLVS
jgi:hypothetical protein